MPPWPGSIIADGYGAFTPAEILRAVPVRIRALLEFLADSPGLGNLAAVGEPDLTRNALADLERRLPEMLAVLRASRPSP